MFEEEMDVALEAVRKGCALCRYVRETLVTGETVAKTDKSPVTIADLGAQAVMSHVLHTWLPQDALVAEEDTELLRDHTHAALLGKVVEQVQRLLPSLTEPEILEAIDRGRHTGGRGRFWTLDPIDGTKGFVRGDQYAVALALVEDGEVVLGVLGCPNLPVGRMSGTARRGALFFARRNGGAFSIPLDGGAPEPIRVASLQNPAQAVFCESFESGHTAQSTSGKVAAALRVEAAPVRIDSQAKYALVARGEATVYMRIPSLGSTYQEKIWDHAAGFILVREAGGQVTDTMGRPLDFSQGRTLAANRGVIVSNGPIHAMVVDTLARVRGI